MNYVKKDMLFAHYRWLDNTYHDSIFTGEPSRRIFDPHNGNQVLFLINYYISILGKSSIHEARALESSIAHKLPDDTKSERSVFKWLMDIRVN